MASSLASQLQALALPGHDSKTRPASLIFGPNEAADIDRQTIFSLAESGFEELRQMDGRFDPFRKTLFSIESYQIDPGSQAPEFIRRLNASISQFLRLLSGYLLLPSSHRVLEYLIRKYRIHATNVDEVMLCILPYHETSLFVQIVQLLDLRKSKWSFLKGVKETGAAPPRDALVQWAIQDFSFLEAVCDCVKIASDLKVNLKMTISFGTVFIMETLTFVPIVSKELVSRILPLVLHSFGDKVAEDIRVAGLMIVGTLSSRATLSDSLILSIFEAIGKLFQKVSSGSSPLLRLALMVMIQLAQAQTVDHFPSKAFKSIIKTRDLPVVLAELTKQYQADNFVMLLLQALVGNCTRHQNYEELLLAVVNTVPIEKNVQWLVSELLNFCLKEDANEKDTKAVAKKILFALEKRFPKEIDTSIGCLLEGHADGKDKDKWLNVLSDVFSRSIHMPLIDSHASLYASVDHPEARIRRTSLLRLIELAETEDLEEESEIRSFLSEVLRRRLYDEDLNVVHAALSCKEVMQFVTPKHLLQSMKTLLDKVKNTMLTGSKGQKGDAKALAKRSFELLASNFLQGNPSYKEEVVHVLLANLIVTSKIWKLNLIALKSAKSLDAPIFKHLTAIQDDGTNRKDIRWKAELNLKIVSAISAAVSEDLELIKQLIEAARLSKYAKFLCGTVILQSFTTELKDKQWELVREHIQFLWEEWLSIGDNKHHASPILQDNYNGEEISKYFLEKADEEGSLSYAELLLCCFYRIICTVPETMTDYFLDVFNELFLLFTSSSWNAFRGHIQMMLTCLGSNWIPFLTKHVTAEGPDAPTLVQVHSLDVLAFHYRSIDGAGHDKCVMVQLQMSLPPLLVALASPLKAVRRSATLCATELSSLWSRFHDVMELEDERTLLPYNVFAKLLNGLVTRSSSFKNNGNFLGTFFCSLLDTKNVEERGLKDIRFDKDASNSLVSFLLANVTELSVSAKRVLLSSLHSAGYISEIATTMKSLLLDLLKKRRLHHLTWNPAETNRKMTPEEVQLLELLIEVKILHTETVLKARKESDLAAIFEVLNIDGSLPDLAISNPCLLALKLLSNSIYDGLDQPNKEILLQTLISLTTTDDDAIRNTAREALKRFQLDGTTISALVGSLLLEKPSDQLQSGSKKKTKKTKQNPRRGHKTWPQDGKLLSCTAALLEFLLEEADQKDMYEAVQPLFRLLDASFSQNWPSNDNPVQDLSNSGRYLTNVTVLSYVQQVILMVLEKIALHAKPMQENVMLAEFDVDAIVQCITINADVGLQKHALALLTAIAKLSPGRVMDHLFKILTVVGPSLISQDESHSHQVVQQMLEAVLPSWLSNVGNPHMLFEIFVEKLPQVPIHRRIILVTNILRISKVDENLHIFLLVFLKKHLSQAKSGDNGNCWELEFAENICKQFLLNVRICGYVKLLNVLRKETEKPKPMQPPNEKLVKQCWGTQILAAKFIASQLQNLQAERSIGKDDNDAILQESFATLMEEVLLLLQLTNYLNERLRLEDLQQEGRSCAYLLLDSLTALMTPIVFVKSVIALLKHDDADICQKILQLYVSHMKEERVDLKKRKKAERDAPRVYSEEELELHGQIAKEIMDLLNSVDKPLPPTVKRVATSALDVSARCFGAMLPQIYISSLHSVIVNLKVEDKSLILASLRCLASILSILGPQSLVALPEVMAAVLRVPQAFNSNRDVLLESVHNQSELLGAVLHALEVIVKELGSFLSPYLQEIISLIVLHPGCTSLADEKVQSASKSLQILLAEKIPARLLLDPLIKSYNKAVEAGAASSTTVFEIVAAVSSKLDRPSVATYHVKIFDFCLSAFSLRQNPPKSMTSISVVEKSVVSAVVALVMKLSETTFKPLFIASLGWSESAGLDGHGRSIERGIVFYKFVNLLVEKLRSVFVPYFRYLLDGCVYYLNGDKEQLKPKKKKIKHQPEEQTLQGSVSAWYMRQLVISALHKCFLYDVVGFLDTTKFEQLLGPLTLQLEDEFTINNVPQQDVDIPTAEQADHSLVLCLGQLALTAGTDLLWKPLNHQVLMRTRSQSVRTRRLAIEVVKFMVEHLKEEYLVLLPETIPFLAEILEDVDFSIVARTQELVKILEDLSGESLSQYL